MSDYVVRRRQSFPFRRRMRDRMLRRPPRELERPWELLRDGLPIGFYETSEAALESSPEPAQVVEET
ncbi:MAG: hypothetical protein Q8Q14_12035 [Gemmatimonadales bacterium]|nr:hypothetical protein [Gemmatimonadales bacterium]